MAQSLARLTVHLIFSTKNRERTIADGVHLGLHSLVAGTLKNQGCEPVLINSVDDHMHSLFELGRTVSMSNVVKEVKTSSTAWIKTRGPEHAGFAWQRGYGAFSVDPRGIAAVRRYVEHQDIHHRTESFQDEYRRFLTEYGLTFDEQYLWD